MKEQRQSAKKVIASLPIPCKGLKRENNRTFILIECPLCGLERWTDYKNAKRNLKKGIFTGKCIHCTGREHVANSSRKQIGYEWTDESKKKLHDCNVGKVLTDFTKEKIRKIQLQYWANPTFKAKTLKISMAAMHLRPNKPETIVRHILNTLYPDEWEYTGDGRTFINNMNPDFTNVKKKRVIEVFGDFWHSDKVTGKYWQRTELGRVMAFHTVGYDCLVIWEHELENPDKVIKRIKTFCNRRAK